jgi:hypothetical protein
VKTLVFVSRLPTIRETFIYREALALRSEGADLHIHQLAADPALRHEMGEQAASLARAEYSLTNNVDRLHGLLRC